MVTLILLSSLSLVSPIVSEILTTYQSVEAEWVTIKHEDGEIETKAQSTWESTIPLQDFQQTIGSTKDKRLLKALLFSLLCAVVVVAIFRFCKKDEEDWFFLAAALQLLVLLFVVLAFLHWQKNIFPEIQSLVKDALVDPALIKVVVDGQKQGGLVGFCVVAIVCAQVGFPIVGSMLYDLVIEPVYNLIIDIKRGILSLRDEIINKVRDSIGFDQTQLVMRDDGTVELQEYPLKFRWFPFPSVAPAPQSIHVMPKNEFLTKMVEDSLRPSFEAYKNSLIAFQEESVGELQELVEVRYVQSLVNSTKNSLLQEAQRLQNRTKEANEDIETLMQTVADKALATFSEEVSIDIQEQAESHTEELRKVMFKKFEQEFSRQQELNADEKAILLPEDVRFYLPIGNTKIVIVEQKPQVRTVQFSRDFVNHYSKKEKRQYTLAFPYIVYLIKFNNNNYAGSRLFFRNTPLRSLQSRLGFAGLPNLDGSNFCIGNFKHSKSNSGFFHRVQEVISHFWQSEFNTDWADGYRRAASNNPQMKNLSKWEKSTREDPMFILSMDWEQTDDTAFNYVHSMCRDAFAQEQKNLSKAANHAIGEHVEELLTLATRTIGEAQTDGRYPAATRKAIEDFIHNFHDSAVDALSKRVKDNVDKVDEDIKQEYRRLLQLSLKDFATAQAESFQLTGTMDFDEIKQYMERGI